VVQLAGALNVVGLMNVQFAIQEGRIYVLEVNPRASRTVPFVSKAIGISMAKVAARCMSGRLLAAQKVGGNIVPPYFSVKEAVFPFVKFPGVDPILGPEMKSTGEVMGMGRDFAEAFAKSQEGAGIELPHGGTVFISVRDVDKRHVCEVARDFLELGFSIVATLGTASVMEKLGIPCNAVNKVGEGRPHIVDLIKNDDIQFIVNTTEGKQAIADSFEIRREALQRKVPYTTTIAGARATCRALTREDRFKVSSIQELHKGIAGCERNL